jgi:hypothetical protein
VKSIQPFLFWIILAVILVVELVIWVCAQPSVDLMGDAAAAQQVKVELDKEYRHLTEMDRRAKNGSPQGVFDAENAADIQRLTDEYLITGSWKEVLVPHVQKYDKHLTDIMGHLKERSKILHKPLADSGDKLGWYTAYQDASESLLKQLHASGCLVLPSQAPGASANAGMGAPLAPGAAPTAATTTSTAPATLDFATDRTLRDIAGLYTKASDYPDAAEHPALTTRFRIVERLAGLLLQAAAANTVNPIITGDAPAPAKAALAGLAWGDFVAPGGGVATYAAGQRLTMDLHGQASSLLAALATLERSGPGPVLVVTGSTLERKAQYAKGERKDVASEQAVLHLSLLLLDFTLPAAEAAATQQIPEPGTLGTPPASPEPTAPRPNNKAAAAPGADE